MGCFGHTVSAGQWQRIGLVPSPYRRLPVVRDRAHGMHRRPHPRSAPPWQAAPLRRAGPADHHASGARRHRRHPPVHLWARGPADGLPRAGGAPAAPALRPCPRGRLALPRGGPTVRLALCAALTRSAPRAGHGAVAARVCASSAGFERCSRLCVRGRTRDFLLITGHIWRPGHTRPQMWPVPHRPPAPGFGLGGCGRPNSPSGRVGGQGRGPARQRRGLPGEFRPVGVGVGGRLQRTLPPRTPKSRFVQIRDLRIAAAAGLRWQSRAPAGSWIPKWLS